MPWSALHWCASRRNMVRIVAILAQIAAVTCGQGASCLGPVWAITGAGNGTSSRATTLEIDNWASHRLVTVAAQILIQEGLGQTVELHEDVAGVLVYERVARGVVDANLEVWTSGKESARVEWKCTTGRIANGSMCALEQFHQYAGHSAQTYVGLNPSSSIPDSDFWRRYQANSTPAMLALPPANFSVPGWAHESCSSAAHLVTAAGCSSSDGRFYPTACGGTNQMGNAATAARLGCRAYFAGSPSWDPGMVEHAIESSGLLLVVTYVGDPTALGVYTNAAAAAGHDAVIFYHWQPSLFLSGGVFKSVTAWNFVHLPIPTAPAVQEDLTKLVSPALSQTNPAVRRQTPM
jgi:hypothetical protein